MNLTTPWQGWRTDKTSTLKEKKEQQTWTKASVSSWSISKAAVQLFIASFPHPSLTKTLLDQDEDGYCVQQGQGPEQWLLYNPLLQPAIYLYLHCPLPVSRKAQMQDEDERLSHWSPEGLHSQQNWPEENCAYTFRLLEQILQSKISLL